MIYLPCLADLYHEVGIDCLSEVWYIAPAGSWCLMTILERKNVPEVSRWRKTRQLVGAYHPYSCYIMRSAYELRGKLGSLAHAYLLWFFDDFASGVREHTIKPLARVQVHVA